MKNLDIRFKALAAGVRLYQIADKLGLFETSLSRLLRKELSDEKKIEIEAIIKSLAKDDINGK